MSATLIQAQSPTNFNHLIGQSYEETLDQAIQALLESNSNLKTDDLSLFISKFRDLLLYTPEPPLETIWVYSALCFQKTISTEIEALNHFSAIKDLFKLITSCSAPSHPLKSVVLVCPVIYNLLNFFVGFKNLELKSKKEKKILREVKESVNSILGYFSVCSGGIGDNSEGLVGLVRSLQDLVSIWVGKEKVQNGGAGEGLRSFFPLLSDDLVERVRIGGCELGELAGYVIAEAFLLKLCLEFHNAGSTMEFQNELKAWSIGSITGLRNLSFFETLLRMLLEPSLPVTALLNPGDETHLRKILYDAVLLPEYSFLKPEHLTHVPAKHVQRLCTTKLMLTHEAVEYFGCREHGDQKKAISYINAFTNSTLPSQLLKWVKDETGIDCKTNGPNGSSPKAFLGWMLGIENRGIRIFDDGLSRSRAKLILEISRQDFASAYAEDGNKRETDLLFYIDNKGEEENGSEEDNKMTETMSAAFMGAARSMQSAEQGGEKRKSSSNDKKREVKFLRYDLYNPSGSSLDLSGNRGSSSGSEVEDPSSDDDSGLKGQ